MVKSIIERFKNSKIIKNSIWMILATIIQMFISLFLNIFIARYLGANNYGVINYGLSFVNFFASVCTLGLNTIVIKYLVTEKENQGQIIWTCILLRIISSIISIMLILIVIVFLKGYDQLILITTFLQSITLIFDSFSIINLWYQSKLESKYTAVVTFIAYIVMALYKIILLIAKKNVIWFAASHCVSSLVTSILLIILYKKHNGQKFSFSLPKGKELLKQSYHFIISGLMVAVYAQTDKIMIGSMIKDISAVGYYSVATTVVSLWSFIPTAIINSFQPNILETKKVDSNSYEKKLVQLYTIVIYLSILYTLFILVFGRLLVLILYGNEYLPAVVSLKIAIIGCLFSFVGVIREFWLICENKQKYAKWFALIGVITNIVLNFIMIPFLGIEGAAIATTITQIMTGLFAPLFFRDTRLAFKHFLKALIFQYQ
ncbi:MAG: flippase [Bacilli bacterium]|nr:flippase [Bacilli bacterium]